MAPPKGNRFWEARSSHGRKPKFSDKDVLWEACVEYFNWTEDNPLEVEVVYQGEVKDDPVHKMRAMTISGLCLFLDISDDTWANYRQKDNLLGVTKKAEQIIYNQKFTGASADLLNANIIARDLGLVDKQEKKLKGAIGLSDLSADELDERLRQLEALNEQSERD